MKLDAARELFEDKMGDPDELGITTVRRRSLSFRYASETTSENSKLARVTIPDLIEYFWKYHGEAGFQASYRFLGSIGGDWRPIDELAHICLTWFKISDRKTLAKVAKELHNMDLIS